MSKVTFLGEFTRYLKSRTDAPPDFHIHAGMAALSVALGNRVWCDGWARPIYPNLWMVVIAPSGFGKSVPLDMSQSLLQKAGLADSVLPDSFSQEALYGVLQSNPVGVFYLQEFASFLGTLNREYNAGALSWLTALFDVPEIDRRVLKSGPVELRRPCITILGASSPDWFSESYRASSLRGGFLARFLFCPSSTAGPYIGHPGPRDDAAEAIMAYHLKQVSELEGRADLSRVWGKFNDWDRTARERLRTDCPPEFTGMRSRAGTLVLKASMLFHVSDDPETLTVTPSDLDKAIRYVEHSHKLAEQYLSEEVAHDRDDADRLRLIEIVRRSGGRCNWSKALKDSHLTADKMERAVKTLEDSERVWVERGTGKARTLVLREQLRAVGA